MLAKKTAGLILFAVLVLVIAAVIPIWILVVFPVLLLRYVSMVIGKRMIVRMDGLVPPVALNVLLPLPRPPPLPLPLPLPQFHQHLSIMNVPLLMIAKLMADVMLVAMDGQESVIGVLAPPLHLFPHQLLLVLIVVLLVINVKAGVKIPDTNAGGVIVSCRTLRLFPL